MSLNYIIKLFLLPFVFLFAHSATAGTEITPMLGYRMGGEFNDPYSPVKLEFKDVESYGFTIDIDKGKYKQITLLYSQQETSLRTNLPGISNPIIDVDVEYFHIGGNQIWIKDKMRPFFGATVGATHFKPQGLNSTSRLSFSFGGGSKFFVTKKVALMIGARAYITLFNSSGSIFCGNGGCSAGISGTGLYQFEANAGITFRFK